MRFIDLSLKFGFRVKISTQTKWFSRSQFFLSVRLASNLSTQETDRL